MACEHSNPHYYQFCGTCGQPLPKKSCTCGAECLARESFCHACGEAFKTSARTKSGGPVKAPERKIKLVQLVQGAGEDAPIPISDKAAVSQEDIDKIFGKKS